MKIFAKVFEKQNSQHSVMVKMIHVLYPVARIRFC